MARKSRKRVPSPFEAQACEPVPVDLWMGCLDVFEAASQFRMPVRSIEEAFRNLGEQTGYIPTNTPFNRALLAVKDYTNDPEIFPAMLTRVLCFGRGIEAARKDARFAKYFPGEEKPDGTLSIGGPLLAAFALAAVTPDGLGFDMDSVLRFASEREAFDD